MQHARFIGGIASRITPLDDKGRPLMGTGLSCWASSLTPLNVVVSCSNRMPRGQQLVIQLAEFGGFLGRVERTVDGGVAIRLLLDQPDQERLSAKIAWYRKRILHSVNDDRSYKRWRPANRMSALLLADGSTFPCKLLDVSASGAAVAAPIRPAIGTPLAVGQIVGKIVRHLEEGFALQFLSIQAECDVEDLLLPLQTSQTAADCSPETNLPLLRSDETV